MKVCSECGNFAPIERSNRTKAGGKKKINHGYCLALSIFATNRPDTENIPLKAKRAVLPNGQHQVELVRQDEIKLECSHRS
jgi:hypothetical protein